MSNGAHVEGDRQVATRGGCQGGCTGRPPEAEADVYGTYIGGEKECLGTGVPTSTLDEVATELRRRECSRIGHSWDIALYKHQPCRMFCSNGCGHPGFRVTPLGEPSPWAALRDAVSVASADLWGDLAYAYRVSEAQPRETSVGCHGLIRRIQDIARVAGPVKAESVDPAMLVSGLYEMVHAEVGIEVEVPDEVFASARAAVG
jgi:hypothetical protein